MNIKPILLSTAFVVSLSSPAATVSATTLDGFSANIGVATDYVWRGISQTDGKPTVSGGLEYETNFGLLVGTWITNVDFSDDPTYELDGYLNFGGEIANIGYNVGYIYSAYPELTDFDMGEINASATLGYFTVGGAILAHLKGADFADNNYIFVATAFPVADELEVGLHLGSYFFDAADDDPNDAINDYIDYNIYADYKGVNLMLSATDLNDDDMKAVISYRWGF